MVGAKKWSAVMGIALAIILVLTIAFRNSVNREYTYHRYKPQPWPEMGIGIDSENNVHIVWNFFQIEDGGHTMKGIWYMELDDDGDVLKEKRRIVDDFTDDPKLAITLGDDIVIMWSTGSSWVGGYHMEGMYYLFDSNLGKLGEYNLDVFYDNKTAIENLYLNDYHYEFNNFTSGSPLANGYDLKGERPVYAVDYNNCTHIVSVGDDGYYSKIDSNGDPVIKDRGLNCIPDCVSVYTLLNITMVGAILISSIVILWILGIAMKGRREIRD